MNATIKYIEEAKKYYQIAFEEIEKAKGNGKSEYAVDGCAKAWLAITIATDALFLKKGVIEENLPKTHRGRIYFLQKYGDKEKRKIFNAARDILHIDGYYDRFIDYNRINECMEDVNNYITAIENDYKY